MKIFLRNSVAYDIAKKLNGTDTGSRTYRLSSRIAIISIALGVFALSVSLSILEGFDRQLNQTARLFTGEIQVGNFQGKTDMEGLEGTMLKLDSILGNEFDFTSSPVVESGILLRSGDHIDGYALRGIDTFELSKFIQLEDNSKLNTKTVDDNDNNADFSYPEIFISDIISRKSGMSIGDTATIYSATEFKSYSAFAVGGRPFSKAIIKNIYSTGMGKYDENIILTNITTARAILFYPPNTFSKIMLRGIEDKADNMDKVIAELNETLGYPFWVKSVRDIHFQEFMWIELQKEPIPIVLSLIIIVAAFTVMTTMLINTVEKTKQIGILRTLGMERGSIYRMIFLQGFSFAVKGIIWGLGISLVLLFFQKYTGFISLDPEIYFIDRVPVEILASDQILIAASTFFLAILASLLPAYYSSKATPLRAINFR